MRAQTINRMPPRSKQVRTPRSRRVADEELADESDMEMETPSEEPDDSEGSLADFIEHDSDEADDASYHSDEEEEDEEEDVAEEEAEVEEEKEEQHDHDSDQDVIQQYTPAMETSMGSVVVDGVRRSMRSTRGRAPVRYVDEEYAELMLEGASHAELFLDSQSEQASEEEDASGAEEEVEEEEEEEEESSEEPQPKRRRLRRGDA